MTDKKFNQIVKKTLNKTKDDSEFYLQAYKELDTKTYEIKLWYKANALTSGIEEKAKHEYVKLRVEQLKIDTGYQETNTSSKAVSEEDFYPSRNNNSSGSFFAKIVTSIALGGITVGSIFFFFNQNNKIETTIKKEVVVKKAVIAEVKKDIPKVCPDKNDFTARKLEKLALQTELDGDTECAIKLWEKIVQKNPSDGSAAVNLAMRLTEEERYKEASPYYERSIDLGVGAYDAFAWYARNLRSLGQTSDAITWFYRTLAVKPTLSDITSELSELLLSENRPYEALNLLSNFDKVIGESNYFKAKRIAILSNIDYTKKETESFTIAKSNNDHFLIYINFSPTEGRSFLIDTGATSLVMDKKTLDASKIRYKILKPNIKMETANGQIISGQKVKLDYLQFGPFKLNDVEATICEGCSLLIGQNILNKFDLRTERQQGVEFLNMTKRTY